MRTTIDDEVKEVFAQYSPDLSDSDAFMKRLNQRLDSVEDVRVSNRARVRDYWMVSFIAFGAGAVAGIFVLLLILLRPASLIECRLLVEGVILRFFAFWREILAMGIVISLALIILPLVQSYRHCCPKERH